MVSPLMTLMATVLIWKKGLVMKGQASGKNTSAVDLLETLPVLLGIVIGVTVCPFTQYKLGLVWFGCGAPLHSG